MDDASFTIPDRLEMAVRLGQLDGAAMMLDLGPVDPIARVVALRLLRRVWRQFTVDRGLPSGEPFEQTDAAERAAFLSILGDAPWATLRWAADQVRIMLPPPIDPDAAALVTHEARQRVRLIRATIAETPLHGPPDRRIAALLARLMDLDAGFSESEGAERHYVAGDLSWTRYDPGPPSDAWAINIAIAQDGAALALGGNVLPLPAIVRRELCRVDRTPAWRQAALVDTIAAAADIALHALYAARASITIATAALSDRRATSRALDAAVLLAGLEELTPTRLARALGCTRPGGVQILGELAEAGLLAPGSDARRSQWKSTSQRSQSLSVRWLKSWKPMTRPTPARTPD